MKKIEILYLSQKDVINVGLTMRDAIRIVEKVLSEHGRQEYENPPKPGVHPLIDAFIHAMPAYLPRVKACGMKWVSGFPGNYKYELPTIMGLIVLNDVNTGQPVAVMDGSYITALRTAAVSGVAAKYLANRDAKILGLIGAGIQARYNLLSLKEVLPEIEVARIYDINEKAVQQLITLLGPHLPFKITACQSTREALEGADVIITATGHLNERIFKEMWVKKGALVLPVHTRGWEQSILENADKFIVDDWQQFSQVQGGANGYYAPLPNLYAQLGEIVVGKKAGRQAPDERIIDFNFGLGMHDIFMATEVLAKAREKKLGIQLPFLDGEFPAVP